MIFYREEGSGAISCVFLHTHMELKGASIATQFCQTLTVGCHMDSIALYSPCVQLLSTVPVRETNASTAKDYVLVAAAVAAF